jgi:hypothetical protein
MSLLFKMSLAHAHSVLYRILNPMLIVILLYTLPIISWTTLHLRFIKCYAESYETWFTLNFILTYTAVAVDSETCTLSTVQSGLLTATENKPHMARAHAHISLYRHKTYQLNITSSSNYAILERMQSSGMWRHVGPVKTDVSEECVASIFRIEEITRLRKC